MASSSSHQWAYDVYVSFRGEDIRKTFMDHFFTSFKRKGIHVYEENDQLNREEACIECYKVIEQSRYLIVVFSRNYALSTLCLKELAKILECKERKKERYEARPIFYDVNPSVVRNQTGSYKEAIMKHEASYKTEVVKWKRALTIAGNLSGWDLQNTTNGHESKFIEIISKEIFNKLIDDPTHVGNNLVGLDARVDKMDLLRFREPNKVHKIGICGIGGIGKTTIAKVIYKLMHKHFEACSFCEDVKDIVNQNGLVHLRKKLLDNIVRDEELKIQSVGGGMKGKKVLIVLDDVDHLNQFEALAGSADWFSPGSMIVVTCRDRQLLRAFQVEHVYEVDLLNDKEAFELFRKYAFRDEKMHDTFIEPTNRILHYANGLPLALKTFGRTLFNKTLREWEYEIGKLQSSPHALIRKVLQISYDGLDADQKNIFLDIACFFNGEKKDYVVKILDVCEPFFTTNFRDLVDKSLVTIRKDRIHMHNLVQEMGRQIVREESKDPGKQSRLWSPTDVLDVLINDKGTELVKGLALDLSCSNVNICGQSFTKMKNLRLLNIYRTLNNFRDTSAILCKVGTASGKLEFLSSELQFLCWHGYPFQHLPSLFCPESLLVLDLSYSCIKQIWSGSKVPTLFVKDTCVGVCARARTCVRVGVLEGFKELALLKLSHCRNIRKTPDFTETPNLKELIFDGCENLVVIHPSIGTLKMLILLNLKNCKNLRILPSITQLESLEHLIISGCSKMENLVGINPSWHSFFSLSSFLRRVGCLPALVLPSLSTLGVLRVLDVSHCNLSGASLRNLEALCSLEELDMSGNEFTNIDANLSQLSRLSCLKMIGCKKLQFLPKLPSSILNLDAQHCISLQELPKLSTMYSASSAVFDFKNCPKVVEKQAIENLLTTFLPQIAIFEKVHVFLPGSRIPGWFSDQIMGDCIKVDLPPHWCYEKLKGLATCAVISPQNHGSRSTYFEIFCTVKDFHGDLIGEMSHLATDDPNIESDQVWLCYRKSDFRWKKAENQIMVSFKCVGINCKVKHCGVRVVCEEDEQEPANGSHMIRWFPTSTAENGGAGNLNLDVGSATIEDEPPWKKFRVL